jgi:hypothetical protein
MADTANGSTSQTTEVDRLAGLVLTKWKLDRVLILGDSMVSREEYDRFLAKSAVAALAPQLAPSELRKLAGVALARAHGHEGAVQDGDQLHVEKIIDAMIEFAGAQGALSR